ncbi:Golgin subfamily A member 7/ERF4 family-domain-containing protein [Phycomyces nitens]|nr:Golgin subfamily A member 7/ERF4 family-domain-containing protein [Phycomyces nitens]
MEASFGVSTARKAPQLENYKRYTDTWLMVHPPLRGNRANRRFSSSSGQSGLSTLTSSSSYHRKALSLDTVPLLNTTPTTFFAKATCTIATDYPTAKEISMTTPSIQQQSSTSLRQSLPPKRRSDTGENEGYVMTVRTPGDQQRRSMTPHILVPISQSLLCVRIERDYSKGDGITQFQTNFPPELEGRIPHDKLLHTVETINAILLQAETLSFRHVFDNIMECLTIYTWPIFFPSKYQKALDHLRQFVETQNKEVYAPLGVEITSPVRVALLYLEIKLFERNENS